MFIGTQDVYTMEPHKLNYDILWNVVGLLVKDHDRKSLCSLLATCHTLYDRGARHILSMPIKVGGRPLHMENFTSFMRRDLEAYVKKIKFFTLEPAILDEWYRDTDYDFNQTNGLCESNSRILQSFLEILAMCNHLTRFEFLGSDEWLKMDVERFTNAIISHQPLPMLMIGGGEGTASDLLASVQDQITSIAISNAPEDSVAGYPDESPTALNSTLGASYPYAWDPRDMISNLENLEELHLKRPVFNDPTDDLFSDALKTLSLEHRGYGPSMELFLQYFFALENLLYYPAPGIWREQNHVDINLEVERLANREAQEDDIFSLSYYGGDLLGFYSLAPSGPITHLDLRMPLNTLGCFDMLSRALRETFELRRLTIQYTLDSNYIGLAEILSAEIPTSVTHLDLTITVGHTSFNRFVEVSSFC